MGFTPTTCEPTSLESVVDQYHPASCAVWMPRAVFLAGSAFRLSMRGAAAWGIAPANVLIWPRGLDRHARSVRCLGKLRGGADGWMTLRRMRRLVIDGLLYFHTSS